MGLLESDASDDFFGHVQAEFAFFEDIVYNELVVARWTPLAEKAAETASQAGALARVQTRALVHSIGQPLQALGFEVLRLEVLAKRFFFQAEDGIRDGRVTGVQTCALPI